MLTCCLKMTMEIGTSTDTKYEEFLINQHKLQCQDEYEDYNTAIVALIDEKHKTASEDQESDEDVTNDLMQVSTLDFRKYIETLRHYYMQEESSPFDVMIWLNIECVRSYWISSSNIVWNLVRNVSIRL